MPGAAPAHRRTAQLVVAAILVATGFLLATGVPSADAGPAAPAQVWAVELGQADARIDIQPDSVMDD